MGYICFLLGKCICVCIMFELWFVIDNLLMEGMCILNLVDLVICEDNVKYVNEDDSEEGIKD